MTKLKSIVLQHLRGIKDQLAIELNGKSLLLYGDNGTGKSSITDSLEWFYSNRIEHLAGEEIGRGGLEALRNVFLNQDEKATLSLTFDAPQLASLKHIFYKKSSLQSDYTNKTDTFTQYIEESAKENLWLRSQDIHAFISASKKEKLDKLLDIIGFSEVIKTRDVLKKTLNELRKEIKTGNYDNRINNQKARIVEYFGSVTNTAEQWISAANEVIKPLKLDKTISSISDIETLLSIIQKPPDPAIAEIGFLNSISDWLSQAPHLIQGIIQDYQQYYNQFSSIVADIDSMNKIILENLLNSGLHVLKEKVSEHDRCPLCLQEKNTPQLIRELQARLQELDRFKKEKQKLIDFKDELKKSLRAILQQLDYILRNPRIEVQENNPIKKNMTHLKMQLSDYESQLSVQLSPYNQLKKPDHFQIDNMLIDESVIFCKMKTESLRKPDESDIRTQITRRLILAREAFVNITTLKREQELLENQQNAIESVYSRFLEKQKSTLEGFLNQFSHQIDHYYRILNPHESVENIRLIPIEKEEEWVGITMEYDFFNQQVSPPAKFLSESHLNALGLVFFLVSVKALNKINQFFILDDIVSGFDEEHRIRIARLLIQEFSQYQVLLMTHEIQWFSTIREMMLNEGWEIKTFPL